MSAGQEKNSFKLNESLKNKTIKGTVWSSIERFSVQGIQFVVMILMARVLSPEDYGLIAEIVIFIAISQTLVDSGFSQALIRKQDRNEIDNSTVFYFNICVGLILYLLLFIASPIIAAFYDEPLLTPITRVIGLGLVFNSLAVVQRAVLTIKLDFKTQAKASLIASIISGVIGIFMTYSGFGVWSIVSLQVSNLCINTILLWCLSHWKPRFVYSWESFKELFGFGSKLLASGIIDTLYRNIYLIVIGKIFKAIELGYYTRAHQFSDFASSNITGIFQRVTYPVLCSIQNDNEHLASVYRKLLKISAYVIFPFMLGMAAVAHPMIICVLTEKWLFSAKLLVPICLASMWYPVHAINLNLLQVKGRSDLFLKLEIIKKIIGVIVLIITIPMGLYAMCWGAFCSSIIGLIINTHYTGKLIHIGFLKQMYDLIPILITGIIMSGVVYITITFTTMPSVMSLTIGIIEGFIIYIVLSKIFCRKELTELLDIINRK